MSAPTSRTLLLAADPVAAWHAWAQAPGGPSEAGSGASSFAAIFVASPASPAAFAVRGSTTTLERWARRPPLVVTPPLERRRALVAAVADVLRDEAVAAGPRAAAASAPASDDAAGFAASAGDAVRELLRATDRGATEPADLGPRTRRWWRVAARYRARLAAGGGCDPAEVRRLATARLRSGEDPTGRRRVAVLGHATLAPDEVALVDELAGAGSLVVMPHVPPWTDANRGAVDDLVRRGWTLRFDDVAAPLAALDAWTFATLEDEARGALAEVKRLRRQGHTHGCPVAVGDVVLVTRDVDAYAEAVRTAADEVGLPVRIDRWVPLAATAPAAPVVAWLEAVARRGAFEPTLAWLGHPRVGRLDADAIDRVRRWRPDDPRAWARATDEAVRRALDWPRHDTLEGWQARLADGWGDLVAAPADALAGSTGADPATDPFADVAVRPVWIAALASLAGAFDQPGHVPRAGVLGALRDALRHTTVRLSDPAGPPADPEFEPAEAFADARPGQEASTDLDAPPDPGAPTEPDAPPPVWLRPLESLADARVPFVLLLGAVDGMLPRAVPDDPVLGFRERGRLAAAGVPLATAGVAGRLEALRFWGVRRAATARCWVGVPAQTGADGRLPSPFLTRSGVVAVAPPERPPASPQAFRAAAIRAPETVPAGVDPVLDQARHAYARAVARETGDTWGPEDGFVGVGIDPYERTWSATQLRELGTCRFKWWVARAWGVAAPAEGPEELTPLLEGRLYHDTLEGALRAAVGLRGEVARAAAADALEDAFEAAEEHERLSQVVPHWSRLRGEHLKHLRGLLAAPDFLPDDHEVLSVEGTFDGRWHGWRVRGRVDRVDRTPTGVELIDYKLSGRKPVGARDAELALTVDLQLPLYRDVAAPALAPGEAVAGAVYVSLRTRARVPAPPPDPADVADLADLLARLRASLAAGFFPPEPHDDICRTCDFAAICRKGPHLARRPPPYRVPPDRVSEPRP